MKKLISTLALLLVVSFSTFAQSDEAYKKVLTEMFELSGTEETYQVAIKQMFGMYKQQYSSVSNDMWDELEAEFNKASMQDLVDLLVPVYKKHLSIDDIKAIIEFYKSDAGKRFATKTPLIMQESMQVGQQWGMKIGQDFAKKMQEKGY
ncbi:DUF2059 domain-containing protein [Seonamhaeicola marinus]|uniref:DUF2059 domain-containing protein n=1 Tax=Seonamhaeicola marinus TaxID=1912246 RepID=A0A5D0IML7_9FLAO|nr:DUF2059 domain-containing protein [Seonamhaeicola marinus]TYA84269.1 DUF2059 domain-containing protein [Seonamhaeicola marinus]